MKIFKMKHKYCGMIITVNGEDKYTVYRKNKLDSKIWIIIGEE